MNFLAIFGYSSQIPEHHVSTDHTCYASHPMVQYAKTVRETPVSYMQLT